MRKKYDKEGKAGIKEGNAWDSDPRRDQEPFLGKLRVFTEVKMDPSTFFSLLFGSERFEPWIGELSAPKHKEIAESDFSWVCSVKASGHAN